MTLFVGEPCIDDDYMSKGIPCPHGKDLIQADIYRSKTCQKCEHLHVNYETERKCCDLQDESNIAALNSAKATSLGVIHDEPDT